MFFARWMRRDLRLKMPIDYHFLFLFIANSVPFVCTNNCHVWNMCVWLLRMYPLTARYVPFDCHVCVCWLPGICLLNAIYVPFVCLNNCHIWATSMPVDCQVCASWLPFLYLLIATCGPVVCHIGASCLPHVAHMWARQRPHVGLTLASVAKRVWPTCVPYVGVISTATCGPCVAHLWNVCWAGMSTVVVVSAVCIHTRDRTCACCYGWVMSLMTAASRDRGHRQRHAVLHV